MNSADTANRNENYVITVLCLGTERSKAN